MRPPRRPCASLYEKLSTTVTWTSWPGTTAMGVVRTLLVNVVGAMLSMSLLLQPVAAPTAQTSTSVPTAIKVPPPATVTEPASTMLPALGPDVGAPSVRFLLSGAESISVGSSITHNWVELHGPGATETSKNTCHNPGAPAREREPTRRAAPVDTSEFSKPQI